MNFFKKLFSNGNKNEESEHLPALDGVFTDTYFNNRYVEQNLSDDPAALDGCLKIIDSFYLDKQVERKIAKPVNHPINLDQIVGENMEFVMYCRIFKIADKEVLLFLAYAFSDFLIKNFGFQLYKDKEPEYQFRFMTLKYNKNGSIMSIYPLEYAAKVLNNEAKFEDLYNRISSQLEHMPTVDEVLKSLLDLKK